QRAFVPNSTTLYSFYDFNAKVNFELGKNDKLYLSAFKGRDNGSYTGANSLNYGIGFGNSTATLRWNHLFRNNLFANTSFILNSYDLGVGTTQGNYYSVFYTGIKDVNAKTDFTLILSPRHTVKFGANYFYHTLFPATFSSIIPKSGNKVKLDPDLIPKKYGNEMALYVNHEWDLSSTLGLSYGLRIPHYFTYQKTYTLFEPRATVRVNINNTTSVKASYTVMNQFVHAIPYSAASLPTDVWIASSSLVKPQQSQQYSLGVFKNLQENLYEVSVEGYYKEMKNQVLFKQGTQLTIESNIEDQLTFGQGTSYGLEFFLKKRTGRLAGWFSYTLSKTTQIFPGLNFGNPFPFTYDRRHSLALVGTYEINDRWSVAADFVFRTGSALTIPPGRIPVSDGTLYDGWYYDFTTRNNARLKAYHRLDVSFSYKKERKFFGRKYQSEWVFGVYNIYSRKNPYFVYLTVDSSTQLPKAKQVSLLPLVPSASFNFNF
ncbi:TonB-dependent receptor, partial [Candidatus Parcubacteria bacterium]|nr:TonB-dependent receptor [Candidatus Parcubacteria bacterium]